MCQKLFHALEINHNNRAPHHPFCRESLPSRCFHSAVFAGGDWQVGGAGRKKAAQGERSPGEEVRKLASRVREPLRSQGN